MGTISNDQILDDGSRRSRAPRGLITIAVLLTLLALTSCPNPIPVDLATQVSDRGAPLIMITSPANGSFYQSSVVLTGTVSDADGPVESLVLDVGVLELVQNVGIEDDGSFTHVLDTSGVTTPIEIVLAATDWNGNQAEVSVRLENDLTGPFIVITEPEDYSPYSTVVRVRGTITDSAQVASTGEVSNGSYAVPGTSVAGDLFWPRMVPSPSSLPLGWETAPKCSPGLPRSRSQRRTGTATLHPRM